MKTVRMPRTKFIREHTRLIKILRYGNRRQINKEASLQSRELTKYLRRSR